MRTLGKFFVVAGAVLGFVLAGVSTLGYWTSFLPVGLFQNEVCESAEIGKPIDWRKILDRARYEKGLVELDHGGLRYGFFHGIVDRKGADGELPNLTFEEFGQVDAGRGEAMISLTSMSFKKRTCKIRFIDGIVTEKKNYLWD